MKKARDIFIAVIVVPVIFFALVEAGVRLSGVDTDVVKSRKFKIETPVWAANSVNFFSAEVLYKDIVNNVLPLESAEWMRYFTEARYVKYRMKPGVDVRVTNTVNRMELARGIKVHMQSDSRGFRTGEVKWKKEPGTYRIVLLGDSTTFGWGVNQNERFSEQLENRLNSRHDGRCYQVINLGIPGYTSFHGLQAFRHFGIRYQPDMVIMSFGANDGKKISRQAKQIMRKSSWIRNIKYFMWNFKTYKLIRKHLLSLSSPFDRIHQSGDVIKKQDKVPFVTPNEFRQNLAEIVDMAQSAGCEPVLLGLCCPIDYLAKMSALAREKGVVMMDGMHLMMQKIPDIKKGLYPKIYRYYRELYGEEILNRRRIFTVTNDSCHPNRLGHLVLADELETRLFPHNGDGS